MTAAWPEREAAACNKFQTSLFTLWGEAECDICHFIWPTSMLFSKQIPKQFHTYHWHWENNLWKRRQETYYQATSRPIKYEVNAAHVSSKLYFKISRQIPKNNWNNCKWTLELFSQNKLSQLVWLLGLLCNRELLKKKRQTMWKNANQVSSVSENTWQLPTKHRHNRKITGLPRKGK